MSGSESAADTARRSLGPVGVWLSALGGASAAEARDALIAVEGLGYPAVWIGEGPQNKEALSHAAILLSCTSSIVVATGIANIYARDALATKLGSLALGDAFPGRFVLGIGASHASLVTRRGHEYERPLTAMRSYLDAMDEARYLPPAPTQPVPLVLAALRRRMLELARDRADGAHPYFVPVAHTERARAILGSGPLLAPELMIVLDEQPERARAAARRVARFYLDLPNYANNLRDFGYEDEDFADGGSDRLIDAIFAWGSQDAIRQRVDEHLAAGADHVAVQPIAPSLGEAVAVLERLAPALLRR